MSDGVQNIKGEAVKVSDLRPGYIVKMTSRSRNFFVVRRLIELPESVAPYDFLVYMFESGCRQFVFTKEDFVLKLGEVPEEKLKEFLK